MPTVEKQTALFEVLIPSSYYDLVFGGANRIAKYENAAFEIKKFLTAWMKKKMGLEFEMTVQVLQYPWKNLNHFYEIAEQEGWDEKYDWLIVMGCFAEGEWMGFFDRQKLVYGYFRKVRWWRGWNKAATWSISHELFHLGLKLLSKPTSIRIGRVHRNDSMVVKDYWNEEGVRIINPEKQRKARYLTLGGNYD